MSSSATRTPAGRTPAERTTAWFWVAAGIGTVHAAWSVYWALGGTWMLASVGQWAVQAAADPTPGARLALWGVAVVKLLAAWVPLLAHRGVLPLARLWRALTWAGAAGLVLYGLANIGASTAVLAGWITPEVPVNTEAHLGHAVLWGPLFALWGVALLLAQLRTVPRREAGAIAPAAGAGVARSTRG